ncbi:hypothetical protein E6Q11_02515 [Candidatus Dojkabacteria bacterium]|uniref:Tail fiber protein n=1 Tax=Candidatus Dojkabacteria bacterium TaxID=2099670 RepID=A0A5C7J9H2_9BACT|nr:MAG: hypothetical protein E6Q11_02515 [Candidatus Dojkabacteria bacterium]
MTISSTENRKEYAGDGVTTVFSFPYYFLANGDLKVILKNDTTGVETLQVITTNYTVSGAGAQIGGSITMVVSPPLLTTLIIYRDPAITQGVDLVENDPEPAETLETAYDRLTMIAQRLSDRVDRAVTLTDGFDSTFDTHLPETLTAGTVFRVNDDGDGFVEGPTADDIEDAQANAAAAAASAAAAAASAAAAQATFYRDVIFKTSADSPYTVTSADNGKLISVVTTGGAVTINLPTISGVTLPFNVAVLLSVGANAITINRGGASDLIGSATSKTISTAGTGCQLIADDTPAPDAWSVLDYGTAADDSITTIKIRDGAVTRPKLASGAVAPVTNSTKTTTATAATTDDSLLLDTTSGAFTVTLYTAVGNAGRRLTLTKIDSATTAATIDASSTQTINGALTFKLATQFESVTIESDGANWVVVHHYIPSKWATLTGMAVVGLGTISQSNWFWKRNGDSVVINFTFKAGTTTATPGLITLPSWLTIDSAKRSTVDSSNYAGHGDMLDSAGSNLSASDAVLFYDGTNTDRVFFTNRSNASGSDFEYDKRNASDWFSTGFVFAGEFSVPISGWEA